METASPVQFWVMLVNQLLGAVDFFIHGETVVPNMDVEGSRDHRDSRPGVIAMEHHFKPWGALQQNGEQAIIGMRCQSNLVTSM
ncbi:hypothetical protein ACP70R_010511 [Stipagrostis hirtigluma subsp. patula]